MKRRMDASTVNEWREALRRVADHTLADGPTPVTVSRLDQFLAAARDAELSEMEAGVFIVTMIDVELHRRGVGDEQRRMSLAGALALRLIETR